MFQTTSLSLIYCKLMPPRECSFAKLYGNQFVVTLPIPYLHTYLVGMSNPLLPGLSENGSVTRDVLIVSGSPSILNYLDIFAWNKLHSISIFFLSKSGKISEEG